MLHLLTSIYTPPLPPFSPLSHHPVGFLPPELLPPSVVRVLLRYALSSFPFLGYHISSSPSQLASLVFFPLTTAGLGLDSPCLLEPPRASRSPVQCSAIHPSHSFDLRSHFLTVPHHDDTRSKPPTITMPVSTRPKLPSLATPTTGNFPSDALLSACSVRTPASAASLKGTLPSAGIYSAGLPSAGLPSAPLDYPPTPSMLSAKLVDDSKPEKTPITPPLAYMDFLKTIQPASPAIASPPLTAPLLLNKAPLKRTATGESAATNETTKSDESRDSTTEDDLDSAPTSASSVSVESECSCMKEQSTLAQEATKRSAVGKPKSISIIKDEKLDSTYPLSAPATGPSTFPSLRVPPSPVAGAVAAVAGSVESPAVRSPWSARSVKSPFDWDAALKARRYEIGPTPASAGAVAPTSTPQQHSSRCDKKGTSIRHIREVVTRTVTYTPRMEPAPRGKRRKLNDASGE